MGAQKDDTYIYLEFNEKLTPGIFANKMFLRVANLHKPNPLVQLNDLLFRGSYDECVGTNLFFEEIEDPPVRTNIFEKNPPIRLKPSISQTKIIRLKQVLLPRNAPSTKQPQESIVLNLNQDYNAVLEKLEQGILNIDDIALKEPEIAPVQEFEDLVFETNEEVVMTEPEREIDDVIGAIDTKNTLEAKYEKLRRLVRRPVKRMKPPETIEDGAPQYRSKYEYHNLERQICQSSDAFRSISCPIIEKTFVGGIDIDRCILQGFLPLSAADLDYELTPEEARKVFTIDNFENLSLPARYLVLKECVSQIEDSIESSNSEELKEVDENGRTIADILDIFRRLVRALELSMGQVVESENIQTGVSFDLGDDNYIKYKYNPASDLVDNSNIFNEDEWIDASEERSEEKVDSDETDE